MFTSKFKYSTKVVTVIPVFSFVWLEALYRTMHHLSFCHRCTSWINAKPVSNILNQFWHPIYTLRKAYLKERTPSYLVLFMVIVPFRKNLYNNSNKNFLKYFLDLEKQIIKQYSGWLDILRSKPTQIRWTMKKCCIF